MSNSLNGWDIYQAHADRIAKSDRFKDTGTINIMGEGVVGLLKMAELISTSFIKPGPEIIHMLKANWDLLVELDSPLTKINPSKRQGTAAIHYLAQPISRHSSCPELPYPEWMTHLKNLYAESDYTLVDPLELRLPITWQGEPTKDKPFLPVHLVGMDIGLVMSSSMVIVDLTRPYSIGATVELLAAHASSLTMYGLTRFIVLVTNSGERPPLFASAYATHEVRKEEILNSGTANDAIGNMLWYSIPKRERVHGR